MLPNNCTYSHSEDNLGTSQVRNTAALGVTHTPRAPSHQGENYFHVQKYPYSHSAFHHLSHSNPLFLEKFLLFAPPFSVRVPPHEPTPNPPQAALTPDHPVPGLLFRLRPLTAELASVTGFLPLIENPPNPQHATVTLFHLQSPLLFDYEA